jgi:hypothetical protein
MGPERIELSAKERERLKVLQDQVAAAVMGQLRVRRLYTSRFP